MRVASALGLLASGLLASSAVVPRTPGDPALRIALKKRQSLTANAGSDIDVLNFALALEFVDIVLFNGALSNFTQADFTNAGFPTGARETVQRVAEDEQAHANFIKEAIIEAGGTPVEPCDYTFPYTDVKSFIGLSNIIEGVGTSAYIGSIGALTNTAHVSATATILAVETRHNALLRYLNGDSPDPAAQDTPLSAKSVTSLAAGFFVPGSCPTGSALAFTPFPALNLTSSGTPTIGSTITVVPETAFAVAVSAAPIYCGFASGFGAAFSTYDVATSSCTIPTANVTAGQTYIALTNSPSLSDVAILAGIQHINIVDNSTFANLDFNGTSAAGGTSNSSTTGGSGSKSGAEGLRTGAAMGLASVVAVAVGLLL